MASEGETPDGRKSLRAKYAVRGYRFALLHAGHVSENIYLVATGVGLQVCATAGFIDDELGSTLGLGGLDNASMLDLPRRNQRPALTRTSGQMGSDDAPSAPRRPGGSTIARLAHRDRAAGGMAGTVPAA